MSSSSKTVVWFRRDLRIEDNPALASASMDGSVLPVFIWCPNEEGQFYPGRCCRWWLKESLMHLDNSLRALGTPLKFIKAEQTISALLHCIDAIGATKVVFNHLYDPASLARDHKVKTQLMDLGISVQSFNSELLNEPWEVYDEDGIAFTNFDSYWTKCMSLPMEPILLPPPGKLVPSTGTNTVKSCLVEDLCLENDAERSRNASLKTRWSPGCTNADNMLTEFINNHLFDYSKNRMKVEGTTTSLLSPYLHFGELSVRKIFQSTRTKQVLWEKEGKSEAEESIIHFLRAIGRREYSRHLCFNFPLSHQRLLVRNSRLYSWSVNENHFESWKQGRTGYPLVDAGMRELFATGWVHSQIRVVTSTFLIKFLLLPWTHGLKYFLNACLDADLEFDIIIWQQLSHSLLDGHKFTYLDCPQVQGCRYDPEGQYVRTWLPEISRLPTDWIHQPWNAPKSVLEAAGVELGLNYPNPIVNIKGARERLDDALITKLNGNSLSMEVPTIAVDKEASANTPFLDQTVPYSQHQNPRLLRKVTTKLDCRKRRMVGNGSLKDDFEILTSVKTPYKAEALKLHDFTGFPLVYPWHEAENNVHKEEEVKAKSSFESLRPFKRTAC